jgi:hypothetical protein
MLSREELLTKADTLPEGPEAIEAYWDGDTIGWCVILVAVYHEKQGSEDVYKDGWIGLIRGDGGDFRVFTGEVPPWPEARLALDVGQEIAAKLGVPFYFESRDFPENECPRWWQREQAYPCERCGILLLQSEPCPWRGLCYHCYDEERRRKKNPPPS